MLPIRPSPQTPETMSAPGWLRQVSRVQPGPISVKSISTGWIP